jgi:hypothetical protein
MRWAEFSSRARAAYPKMVAGRSRKDIDVDDYPRL